jgi:cobalt/nickel transport system permease protein
MHIAEGFLPPFWALFWFILCIPFLFIGIKQINKLFKENESKKLLLAVAGAFIFVLSSLKLPSVVGSSSHPTGTGLAAILFGFPITTVLSSIVLIFQALLLAHGGITTLGADIFSMGIVGPAAAYFLYKFLRKTKTNLLIAVFIAALISDWVTYITTSFQLALAYPGENIINSFLLFSFIFAITQIPIAIAEAILITIFFDYIQKTNPKILSDFI